MSCPYKSLVFFDLESTDLPHSRPEITEISFVACSTDHFVNIDAGTELLPRVLHKLTICLNPVKKIVPEAVVLTGLDNFLLADENVMSPNTLKLLGCFIENLPQPVCLVAHYGTGFDFPLLARKFKENKMMIEVACVDSLVVFRKIDEENERVRKLIDSELAELKKQEAEERQQQENDSSVLLSDTADDALISAAIRPRSDSPDLFADIIDDDTLSQLAEEAEHKFNSDFSTPVNKKIRITSPPKLPPKPRPCQRLDQGSLVPRRLFNVSYKLTNIFERFYGRIPDNAHRAEEDVLILLKCARFRARDFLIHIPGSVRLLQSYVK